MDSATIPRHAISAPPTVATRPILIQTPLATKRLRRFINILAARAGPRQVVLVGGSRESLEPMAKKSAPIVGRDDRRRLMISSSQARRDRARRIRRRRCNSATACWRFDAARSHQRPLISTCSTSEAVAAWIGRSADRAGPTPTPSNETGGDPDDVPALTTRLVTVNGRRFSTLSVVLPSVRRAGLTVTKAPAIARSIDFRQGGAVEHVDRRIVTERDLAQRQP